MKPNQFASKSCISIFQLFIPQALKLKITFLLFFMVSLAYGQNCSVNAGIDQTICGDVTSYQLSGSSAGSLGAGTSWLQVGGPSVTIADPADLNTEVSGFSGGNSYRFRLSTTCQDGIVVFEDVTITVENITIADAGTDIESCPDTAGGILISGNAPNYPGETGTWSIIGNNSAGVVINTPNSNNTTIDLPEGNAGTTTLRWTITGPEYSEGLRCETYDEITVTNYGGVEPVDAGPDQTLNSCYTVSQSTQLHGSFAGNGTGGQQGTWEFVSGPRPANIVEPNNNQTQVNGLYQGTYVFRWNVSGPCVNGSDTVTITVDEATQDVTKATVADNNQVFCNPGVTSTTLIGNQPEFAGETVLWRQTSGPTANITNPNSPTTEVTGLSYNNTYKFNYTITNNDTGCSTATNVTVSYSDNNLSIEANNGNDIVGACGELAVDIPFVTTGNGTNEYSIISGPPLAFTYPTPYESFGNDSPLALTFEKSGTYNIALRRRVTGDILSECDIATTSINVTVSVAPTPANGGTDQVLACGITETAVTGSMVESGKSLWTQISGPNQATIENPFARITDITGLAPGEYVFRYLVTAAGGSCTSTESTQSDISVVVSSNIFVDASDAGPDQSGVCSGFEVQLAANEADPGAIGTWQQVSDSAPQTVVFADANDPNTTATGFDEKNQTYTLEWILSSKSGSCTTTSLDQMTVTTTDTEAPTPADAGDDGCYPAGTTEISLQGNDPKLLETGTWTVSPNGPVITDINAPNTTVTVPNDGEYIFTWSISGLSGCSTTTDDVSITVEDVATADAGPDQTVCATTLTMNATSSNGSGEWTQVLGPGGFTIVDPTSPTTDINFTYSGSYVFEWTVHAGECSTDSDQVTLNVGLPPTQADAGPDQALCDGGNTVNLAANAFDSDTEIGTWTVGAGSSNTPTITDPNDPNTTVTGLLTGEYTFIWSIKGDPNCEASTDEVTIRIATPANAGPDQDLCNATNVLLQAEEGSTGTWTQVSSTGSDAIISQSPANSNIANVQIDPGTDYVFRFTTDTPSCSSSDEVAVTNSGVPAYPPEAGDNDSVCMVDLQPANTYTLNGNTPPANVSTTWRVVDQPDGGNAQISTPSDPNTTVTNLTVPGFYILEWNFSVGNCTTESDILRLTVFQPPSDADAGPDQDNACILSAQMNAVAPTAGVGTWSFATDPSNGDAVIDSPNSPTTTLSNITSLGTYTLIWTVSTGPFTDPSGCVPKEDTVDITFNDDPPFEANAGPDQELCMATGLQSIAVTLDAEDIPAGDATVGTWTVVDGPNTPTFANENNANTAVTGLIAGEYEFMWTTEKGGCTDEDSMLVIVYDSPSVADAGPNQIIAEFTPLVLAGNTPTVGTGTWAQLDGPTDVLFTNPNNPTTSVNNIEKGVYYFSWTIENGSCSPTVDVVKVTVIGSADLELNKSVTVKTVTPNVVSPGDIATFTIQVYNNDVSGTSDATGVSVADVLPNGYTIVGNSISDQGVYYTGNSAILWEDLSIPLGSTKILSFQAVVEKEGDFVNKAQIFASDQMDPDSDPNSGFNEDDLNDGIPDDDEDTAEVIVEPADLELTKSADRTSANIGEVVRFRLDLLNQGPGSTSGIVVKDSIPDGYTFVNGSASNNGVYNPGDNSITWSNLFLNAGFTNTLTYEASPNGLGTDYTNKAEITASNNIDPDSDPNSSTDEDDLNDGIADDDETELTVPLSQSDLSLDKTVDNTNPNIGESITFTLTLTNESDVDATGVTVEDYVPSGYNILTINNSGIRTGNTITWTGFDIPARSSLTTSVTVEVLTPTGSLDEYLNVAQVTAMDQLDSDSSPDNDDGDQSEDDETHVSIVPQMADLSLSKSVNPSTPTIGDTVTFTLVVTNDGPSDASGVSVVDHLPAGYGLTQVNNGGSANGNTATWTNLSIANGGSMTLSYTAEVVPGNGGALNYTNTAQIASSDQYDPDSTPNNNKPTEDDQAIASITPTGIFVDLEVTKTANVTNANPGDTVAFTVTVANTSTEDATNVVVTDLLNPNGYTFVSSTPGAPAYDPGNGAWSVGTITAGQSQSLTITATVVASANPDVYVNVAQVTAQDQLDIDSTPANNDPSEDDQDEVNPTITPLVDLNLGKTVNISDPEVGSDVIFTLTLLNEGPTTAPGVEVEDILPSGYTFVNAVATDGVYDNSTGVWTLANNLGVGKSESLQITATVNPAGDYLNTAEVSASTFPDSDSTPANGDTTEDDYAEVATTPIPQIDLSLNKTVDNINPSIGETVLFTLEVANAGPSDATNVAVKDKLPVGLEYVSDNSGGAYDETTGIWTIGSIGAGGNAQIEVSAKVLLYQNPLPTADYLNIAEIFSADEEDIDSTPNNGIASEDDQDEVQLNPQATLVDLEVNKTVDNPIPIVGDNVTFTITVNNEGPQDATGVIVSDKLNQPGFAYVSHSTTGGSYIPNSGAWEVGNLANGASETLEIVATVEQTGSYVNTAQVSGQDQLDADSTPGNNDPAEDDYSTLVVSPQFPADLALTKSVNNATQDVGGLVSFTINVTNNGPAIASGVEVTDLLPSGYAFVGANGPGSFDETTGIWSIGTDIPVGASINGIIVARINAMGDYLNEAEITAADQTDPNTANNSDDATVTPNALVDLSLDKLVSKLTPNVGENINFTLALTNDGPNDASNIEVTDLLPNGYTFVSSDGNYDQNNGVWSIPNLIAGETLLLEIVAAVNVSGPYLNTAEVTAQDQTDIDSTPNNGVTSEDDMASIGVIPKRPADLEVTKTVDNTNPTTGEEVTFTITVFNNPNGGLYLGDATGVVIRDLLPSGFNFVSATASSGTYDEVVGSWNIGDLPNGNSQTLQITASVRALGNYSNTAELIALDNEDPDSTPANGVASEDDQATVTITPGTMSDMELTKTVNLPTAQVGDIVQFTINVVNKGPSLARGVEVTDLLPAGFTYLGNTTTSGTYEPTSGIWAINNIMGLNTPEVLTLVARVNASSNIPNEYTNVAEITATVNSDPDSTPGNNDPNEDDQDLATVTPGTKLADLSLTKTADNTTPDVGNSIQFVIKLTNDGPDATTGVIVSDPLPDGFTYSSHFATAGNYDPNTGIWNLNQSIPPGNSEELAVSVTVNAPTGDPMEFTNRAQITQSDLSDPDSDPNTGFDDDDLNDGIDDDDEAELVIEPKSVDIGLEKVVDKPTPAIGQEVSFSITATNHGQVDARNLEIQDQLPQGYAFVNATPSVGNYKEGTGTWTIPSLAASAQATLSITAEVLDVDDYVNVVSLAYVEPLDLNPDNDQASASVDPICLTIYNEFSPNKDMVNEYFHIDCIENYPNNRLEVYNRWGNLVYSKNGYQNDWDGTSVERGTAKALPVGTYYYILDLGDNSKPTSGWLYIKR